MKIRVAVDPMGRKHTMVFPLLGVWCITVCLDTIGITQQYKKMFSLKHEFAYLPLLIGSSPKCGPWTSSSSIWELVKCMFLSPNPNLLNPKPLRPRVPHICVLSKPSGWHSGIGTFERHWSKYWQATLN